MKKLLICLIFLSNLAFAAPQDSPENDEAIYKHNAELFKNADKAGCDEANQKTENPDQIMTNNTWSFYRQCWNRSMNKEIDKRLVQLKKSDPIEFHKEMELQKSFKEATKATTWRDCGSGTLAGTPGNAEDIQAFKYRTKIAELMNNNELTIPVNSSASPYDKGKDKEKFTKNYKDFIKKLCALPKDVWKNHTVPADCEAKAYQELDALEFTDDVCDLS